MKFHSQEWGQGWEGLSGNLIPCDFRKSVLCFLVLRVMRLGPYMISKVSYKSLALFVFEKWRRGRCLYACIWGIERGVSPPTPMLALTCPISLISANPAQRNCFFLSCFFLIRRGRWVISSLESETLPWGPTKNRSKSVGRRQGEQGGWESRAPSPDSWAKERCMGLTLRWFSGLLLASREQYPMGIVKNKCVVIALGLAGPKSPGLQTHHLFRVFLLESSCLPWFNLSLLSTGKY